jgi:hypothetical protein
MLENQNRNSRVENPNNKRNKNAKEDSEGREELEEGGRKQSNKREK